MMIRVSSAVMHVSAAYQPIFRELGIDADAVFEHALIKPWRTLSDRENCTLDATLGDGRRVRWHLKRYGPTRRSGAPTPAETEVAGLRLLERHDIPSVTLVSWGKLDDGRSFIILDDLSGFEDAEKLIARGGAAFAQLLQPTARLAARLHRAGLHHRDLYLCHFFAKVGRGVDLRLIDTARVRELPRFFGRRWIIKDLAQFIYSTMSLPITDEQRQRWLDEYARAGGMDPTALLPLVRRKVRWIERHDRALHRRQPNRNISIPS
jgi:hypothetical protein